MKSKKSRYIFALVMIVILTALDQFTKYLVAKNMTLGEAIPLIKGAFQLRYITNVGAAWSMFENKQIIFILMTPIVIFFLGKMFVCLPEEKKYVPMRYISIFLISGAIGNWIDRIFRGEVLCKGAVVDFFDFCLINFPVFNVADMYVSLSMVALVLLMLFKYRDEDFDVIYNSFVKFRK